MPVKSTPHFRWNTQLPTSLCPLFSRKFMKTRTGRRKSRCGWPRRKKESTRKFKLWGPSTPKKTVPSKATPKIQTKDMSSPPSKPNTPKKYQPTREEETNCLPLRVTASRTDLIVITSPTMRPSTHRTAVSIREYENDETEITCGGHLSDMHVPYHRVSA